MDLAVGEGRGQVAVILLPLVARPVHLVPLGLGIPPFARDPVEPVLLLAGLVGGVSLG